MEPLGGGASMEEVIIGDGILSFYGLILLPVCE